MGNVYSRPVVVNGKTVGTKQKIAPARLGLGAMFSLLYRLLGHGAVAIDCHAKYLATKVPARVALSGVRRPKDRAIGGPRHDHSDAQFSQSVPPLKGDHDCSRLQVIVGHGVEIDTV